MSLIGKISDFLASLRLSRLVSTVTPEPEPDPDAPTPKRRGRKPGSRNKMAGVAKVTRRRKRRTVRRAKPGPDGTTAKPVRRRCRKATRRRAPRKAAVAAPAEPAPSTALTVPSKGQLVVFKAKAITAERFFDLAEIAKDAAKDALGDRWDLVAGQSQRLMVPSRYRSFKTAIGTRIRISGDRRYPVAQYWPGGVLPPLVLAMPEYRWEGRVRRGGLVPRERWLTFDGPALELVPEVDDERAALAEAEAAD